tara:strand:+ start:226 stop:1770 length:1545 start_codon:yes stop_codon:yes gene_type:complete
MKHFLLFFVFNLIYIYSYSSDILVNNSGADGTYLSIEEAVEAAENGDRILISPKDLVYNIDTLVINKNLTLMPYSSNSFVHFKGNIHLVLDSITDFTIIGFRYDHENEFGVDNLYSTMTDTSRDFLSTINIIDCRIKNIRMDQPKTSTYLSYSDVYHISFSHGDIIGNKIGNLNFGNFDYSQSVIQSHINCDYTDSDCKLNAPRLYWSDIYGETNPLNDEHCSECDLFSYYIPFGDVNVYSDTCNIIANFFTQGGHSKINFFNLDFPINLSNNFMKQGHSRVYLMSSAIKGTNQIINNVFKDNFLAFSLAYCEQNSTFNFFDIKLEILNNDNSYVGFYSSDNPSTNNYNSLQYMNESVYAYNTNSYFSSNANFAEDFFEIGTSAQLPDYNSPGISNPSLKYLNLDLTVNSIGTEGGSHAWSNYHGVHLSYDWRINKWGNPNFNFENEVTEVNLLQDLVDYNAYGVGYVEDHELNYNYAGRISGDNRARITYLNLPTQIFNPANIKVKARAVHGN